MKNLLLLLVLANVLYFMWSRFTTEDPQPGVAVVDESDLGPPLQVTLGQGSDTVASAGAVLGLGEPSDLEAVVGRSCVTIGPFKVSGDADSAALEYGNEGMRTVMRSEQGQIFVGHWVQIRNVAEGAEKIELQARSLDLPADISPRMREGTVFFVDIGLPPGKGAGAIVEKYGEELVAMRDAATCPQ
jgi:hypothetical protein